LPNSNSIGKSTKSNPKKRKKSDVETPAIVERPKPEIMPPKPPFTYAQLIYRAIKDIGGKATLQEICNWITNKHEYYQHADASWMVSVTYKLLISLYFDVTQQSSVRHNLSSSRAFLKGERCGGERGKGFFWSVDEKFAQTLEEQEMKAQQAAAAAAQGLQPNVETKGKKKDKNARLEPPLKRSIKGDTKGAPLPPPLTSSPLAFKTTSSTTPTISNAGSTNPASTQGNKATGSTTSTINSPASPGVFTYPSQFTHPTGYAGSPISGPNPYVNLAQSNWGPQPHPGTTVVRPAASTITTTTVQPSVPTQASTGQPAVPDVIIPIVLGPIPSTHPDYAPGHPNNSAKEGYMVLHERKLILDPDVFVELTKEMLEQLEKMGAPTALSILTGHMIRALKERRARERGRDRGTRRPKGHGRGGAARKSGSNHTPATAPFALDHSRKISAGNEDETKRVHDGTTGVSNVLDMNSLVAETSADVPLAPTSDDPGSPLIDIDGDSEDEGPAAKKRKVEGDPITSV
jgi:forkhead box protein K